MGEGRTGRLLIVDLTAGSCRTESIPPSLVQDWLGGRGLGVALFQGQTGGEAPLVLAGGALSDTRIPLAGRSVLTGRSPLTGTIFSCSGGGRSAVALRQTGFDALVLTGASTTPVLLTITSAGGVLEPAATLWGLSTGDLFARLGEEQGTVAAIGPAGENGVRFASVETSDGDPFVRGGLGADMGRRRLKALQFHASVALLPSRVDVAALHSALQDLQRLVLASPFLYGPFGIREHGTTALVDLLTRRGMAPSRNFTAPLPSDGLNAAALRQRFSSRGEGCNGCPVCCRRRSDDGLLLPEYDDLAALAACAAPSDLTLLVTAADRCRQLGLDPVSAAGALAAWSEITGRWITAAELPGFLERIAAREGEGAVLAEGAERLSSILGSPDAAVTVKGLELPPYDPRGGCGLALAYAVAPHGGTHLDAWPLASELLRKPVPTDPFSFDGKARIIASLEEMNAALDSLVACRFAACATELEEWAALLTVMTGELYSAGDLSAVGARIVAAERAFNRGCGMTETADRLPDRFFERSSGPLLPLDRQRFDEELARYHRIRAGQQV